MNYIFGLLLSLAFIVIKILYEKIYNKNNIIELKKYISDFIILLLSYYSIINLLTYFNLTQYLIIIDDITSKTFTSQPQIFTNEPPF